MTYVTAYCKLKNTDKKSECGYQNQKGHTSISMHNVLHRCASDDSERTSPEIEAQVPHANQPLIESVQGFEVFGNISQQHRNNQNDTDFIEYQQERRHESHAISWLNQRETNRYERSTEEIRKEYIGGHLLQTAPQLQCNNSGSGSARPYDAGQNRLKEVSSHCL